MAFLLVGSMAVVLASLLLRQPVSEISGELFSVIVAISLALVLHPAFQKQWMIRFMTRLKNAELRLELDLQSSFDPMTGLLTRGRFLQIANEVLANQEEGYRAVCIIDLDRFKRINDTYGHQAGDKAIRTASALLMEELIRKMNVADFGEFQGLHASIGVTDAEGTDLETLYRYADLALYDAKKQGKNRVVYLKSDI